MNKDYTNEQIFIVVDIESDGPNPGFNSLISIGAVATTRNEEVSQFYEKLQSLDELEPNVDTMAWWRTQPEAWAEVTTDTHPAVEVISRFLTWVKQYEKPVFVAHPTVFDYAFIEWYLNKFTNEKPFKLNGNGFFWMNVLDLQSYISGKFGLSTWNAHRKNMPAWMREGMPNHTHNALDDARGYGVILRNVLKDRV